MLTVEASGHPRNMKQGNLKFLLFTNIYSLREKEVLFDPYVTNM
jgi:hypothetical protein